MKLISFDGVKLKLGGEDGPCRRTIEKMIDRGEFVQPVQVSPGRVMFIEDDVDAWIMKRQRKGAA